MYFSEVIVKLLKISNISRIFKKSFSKIFYSFLKGAMVAFALFLRVCEINKCRLICMLNIKSKIKKKKFCVNKFT